LVEKGKNLTPDGRVLSFVFETPREWRISKPLESIITKLILNSPESRDNDVEWIFSGNLGVRICNISKEKRQLTSENVVLMFRKKGPKAFLRRSEVSKVITAKSTLNSLHPAFTRDVANNVWHLPTKTYKRDIRQRLSMLLTWFDEKTAVIQFNTVRYYDHEMSDLDSALIGVPQKVDYEW
jgi:hypothetical protein